MELIGWKDDGYAVCTNDGCMAEEVEPYVSFFIASRRSALALTASMHRFREHDQDGRSIVGLAQGCGVGGGGAPQ